MHVRLHLGEQLGKLTRRENRRQATAEAAYRGGDYAETAAVEAAAGAELELVFPRPR